jgi:hypothetical protein
MVLTAGCSGGSSVRVAGDVMTGGSWRGSPAAIRNLWWRHEAHGRQQVCREKEVPGFIRCIIVDMGSV